MPNTLHEHEHEHETTCLPLPNQSPQEGLRLRGALLQSALLVEAKSACQSLAASPVDSGDDIPIAW